MAGCVGFPMAGLVRQQAPLLVVATAGLATAAGVAFVRLGRGVLPSPLAFLVVGGLTAVVLAMLYGDRLVP